MKNYFFKIDPHIHSKNSSCSKLTLKQILFKAYEKDLDAICITDHDIITKMPLEKNILILIGSEITTKDGHILAYGISELIPRMLSAEETIDKIHEQGGIAVAAHPYRKFDQTSGEKIGLGNNDKIYSCHIDGIETLNFLNDSKENEEARKIAKLLKLPMLGGSDAHQVKEIGKVITKASFPLQTIDDFVYNIKKGNTIPSLNR